MFICAAIFSSDLFAEEIDLVELFGHPILAVSSSQQTALRQEYRRFKRREKRFVHAMAQKACKMAGFSQLKEYSTIASNDSEVWVLASNRPLNNLTDSILIATH